MATTLSEQRAAGTIQSAGYAAQDPKSPLRPFSFERQAPKAGEVLIDILFCGVCHSDLHQVRNEWQNTVYPCLPGHEIIGRIAQIGGDVTKFKVGELAGVGCMVGSDGTCDACKEGLEQYCKSGFLATYNGPEKPDGSNTFGGYSKNIVVPEHFVLRIPENMDSASAAPLLCSGVTTYSPLRHWNVGSGQTIGIAGIGGLGHVAVQLAKALGADVIAFTTSASKRDDALRFGAKDVVVSTDADAMRK